MSLYDSFVRHEAVEKLVVRCGNDGMCKSVSIGVFNVTDGDVLSELVVFILVLV